MSDETTQPLTAEEAAIAAEEAKAAAEEALKEAEALKEKEEQERLSEMREEGKKVLGKEGLPDYYTTKKFANHRAEQESLREAANFLIGLLRTTVINKKTKAQTTKTVKVDSYSAKITYVGPRRMTSKQLILGVQDHNPNTNNWRIFTGSVRFFNNQEYGGNIKDAKFIRDCTHSKYFVVRWVKDVLKKSKELKKEAFEKSEEDMLKMNLRLRKSRLQQGLQFPVTPGEAVTLLTQFKADKVELQPKIKKYLEKQAKKK